MKIILRVQRIDKDGNPRGKLFDMVFQKNQGQDFCTVQELYWDETSSEIIAIDQEDLVRLGDAMRYSQ